MHSRVEGRQAVTPTEYNDVSIDKLVRIYKKAYINAGFELKEEAIRKEEVPGGINVVRLTFEFSLTQYRTKKKAVVSYTISFPDTGDRECNACLVYPETFGGDLSRDYDPEEWAILLPKLISADEKANAEIRLRLGKSVRGNPPKR